MNYRYLKWIVSRQLRQPACLFLAGIVVAILAAFLLFVSFDIVNGTIKAITIGKLTISEPANFIENLLPSMISLLSFVCFFLYLLAATSSAAEAMYHPMNAILLLTPLTRKQLFLSVWMSTALIFIGLSAIFASFFCLLIGIKTGIYNFNLFAGYIGWSAVLYASCSALIASVTTVFKKSMPVLIIAIAVFALAPMLNQMHEWYFSALGIMFPYNTIYLDASIAALFQKEESSVAMLPFIVSALYLCGGMFLYDRQDVR